MHDPAHLLLFIEVAERRSISAAARALRMSRATATRRLAALEEDLGVQLVRRTTNELSLTEAGHAYLEHAQQAYAALRRAEDAVRHGTEVPRGVLKLTAPILSADALLTPLLTAYSKAHPEVRVEVVLDADVRKLVTDGFDVGLQAGLEENATLKVRRLMHVQQRLMASTRYLEAHGTPTSVDDLDAHHCLVTMVAGDIEPWPHLSSGKPYTPTSPKLVSNSLALLEGVVTTGMGIGLLPLSLMYEQLQEGTVVPVLDDVIGHDVWVSLVQSSTRIVPPKVRSFVDFTVDWVQHNMVPKQRK